MLQHKYSTYKQVNDAIEMANEAGKKNFSMEISHGVIDFVEQRNSYLESEAAAQWNGAFENYRKKTSDLDALQLCRDIVVDEKNSDFLKELVLRQVGKIIPLNDDTPCRQMATESIDHCLKSGNAVLGSYAMDILVQKLYYGPRENYNPKSDGLLAAHLHRIVSASDSYPLEVRNKAMTEAHDLITKGKDIFTEENPNFGLMLDMCKVGSRNDTPSVTKAGQRYSLANTAFEIAQYFPEDSRFNFYRAVAAEKNTSERVIALACHKIGDIAEKSDDDTLKAVSRTHYTHLLYKTDNEQIAMDVLDALHDSPIYRGDMTMYMVDIMVIARNEHEKGHIAGCQKAVDMIMEHAHDDEKSFQLTERLCHALSQPDNQPALRKIGHDGYQKLYSSLAEDLTAPDYETGKPAAVPFPSLALLS